MSAKTKSPLPGSESGRKPGPEKKPEAELSPLPELLSPAGSEEALRAALAGGADAVYFGSTVFSNRMRAKNFDGDELTEAIRLVHRAGARAHITVNTRVRDREMDDALRLCDRILGGDEDSRADAIIIADLGLAAQIRSRYPHAVFHASTQTSLGSPRDLEALNELGFARLVLPRELSREEIAALTGGPLECEIFLHGAHCMSFSGQCLMSYYCGGRSGNRGECAQPCRLPYRVDVGDSNRSGMNPGINPGKGRGNAGNDRNGQTPLSLADLCLAGRIRDVLGTGICSLKIEGRLKSAAYVYGVTKIYRRLLDERRDAEPGEIRELASLFGRGFTDGFYAGKYRGTGSARADGTAKEKTDAGNAGGSAERIARDLSARLKAREEASDAPRKIRAEFVMRADAPASLELIFQKPDEEVRFLAEGGIPSPAVGRDLGPEGASRSLTKFGGTGFFLASEDLSCRIEPGLWMPASALNALRRAAADGLKEMLDRGGAENGPKPEAETEAQSRPERKPFVPYAAPLEKSDRPIRGAPLWSLELADARLADGADRGTLEALFSGFARVYVPAHQYARFLETAGAFCDSDDAGIGPELCAVMPVFPLPGDGWEKLCRSLADCGCRRILSHGIGGFRPGDDLSFGGGREWKADLSFRGNVTNAAAAKVYRDAGFASVGLSPELPAGAVRALGEAFPVSSVAYGRVPVMTTARCVLSEKNPGCRGKGGRDPARLMRGPDGCFCRGTLTDRRGEVFPVLGQGDCSNVLYNARPVWMGDRLDELAGAESLVFLWTVETPEEMLSVLRKYENGDPPEGEFVRS